MKTGTLDEAQRDFQTLVAEARAGQIVSITIDGKPAVELKSIGQPFKDDVLAEERRRRHLELLDELVSQPPLGLGKFDRSKLYDD